jgi:hypothetical protein
MLVFWHVWRASGSENYAAYAEFKNSAWYPVSFFKAWSIPLLDAQGLELASTIAAAAMFLSLVGFLYPVSAPIAALLTLYLRAVPQNFGKVNHSENLLIFALFVLAFSRAGARWSVDAVLRRWLCKSASPIEESGHYRWPVRFIGLLVAVMYGAAGASKLIHSGWDWALSDSFRWLLLRHHFTHHPPTQIGVWLADFPLVCRGLALAALVAELCAPLALLGKWTYRLLIPAVFALQVSIWLLLGVRFASMLPLFLCLLPWGTGLSWCDRLWLRVMALMERARHRGAAAER